MALWFIMALIVSIYGYEFMVGFIFDKTAGWWFKLYAVCLFVMGFLAVYVVIMMIYLTKDYLEATHSIQKAKDLNIVPDEDDMQIVVNP